MKKQYTTAERNAIYKKVLAEFNKIQLSHNNDYLSFGLCAYFIDYDIHNFPEIMKHRPKDHDSIKYDGYWFSANGQDAIKRRRNILKQAIMETTDELMEQNEQTKKSYCMLHHTFKDCNSGCSDFEDIDNINADIYNQLCHRCKMSAENDKAIQTMFTNCFHDTVIACCNKYGILANSVTLPPMPKMSFGIEVQESKEDKIKRLLRSYREALLFFDCGLSYNEKEKYNKEIEEIINSKI